MSKSILVIDMPTECRECPCISGYDFGTYCEAADKEIEYDYEKLEFTKPIWCPLLPLPERKDISHLTGATLDQVIERQYKQGFNDCLYEIRGETKC